MAGEDGTGEAGAGRARDDWGAEEVQRLREHLGLTQAEMSELLNARQQTISEWERGRHRPRGPSARLLSYVAEAASFDYEAGSAEPGPGGADAGDARPGGGPDDGGPGDGGG